MFPLAFEAGISALGGILGGRSAKKAAKAREQAYTEAGQTVNRAYNEADALLDPRGDQELAAIARVNALLGLDGAPPDYSTFREAPGYQWRFDQGMRAAERSAAAGGNLLSGNTLIALQEYGQGMADQGFNDYLDRVLGLSAQGVDMTRAGMRIDEGNALADLRLGAAGARASGIEGKTAATIGGLSGVASALGKWKNPLAGIK